MSEENPARQVLIYSASDDIEADLKKMLHPKAEIPSAGWFGVFQDPTGNVLAVYTSMNPANN